MPFVSPRQSATVEVLYKNKDFSYKAAKVTEATANSSTPISGSASRSRSTSSRFNARPKSPSFEFEALSPIPLAKSGFNLGFGRYGNTNNNNAFLGSNNKVVAKESDEFLRLNYNDYDPVDILPLPKHKRENNMPLFLQVVSNEFDFVNNLQILLVAFETHLELYSLDTSQKESTENEEEEADAHSRKRKTDSQFAIKKLQECSDIRLYGVQIQSCALSHLSCVSSVTKRVMYAFTILGSETIFLVREENTELTEDVDICNNQALITEIENKNRSAVTHLAFSYQGNPGEEFLAYLDDGRVCTVVDIKNEASILMLPLKSPGVAVSFHPSENYKLLVVDMGGLITIFNIAKQCAVQSINLCTRILSCHWCPSNPLMVAVANVENCFIIDLSKPHAAPASTKKPFSTKIIKKIAFSDVDPSVMVILGGPQSQIKVFKSNGNIHNWAKVDIKISALAWLVGMPYLIVLSGDTFKIFDSGP